MLGSLHDRIGGQWTTLWFFLGIIELHPQTMQKKHLLPFWKNVPSFNDSQYLVAWCNMFLDLVLKFVPIDCSG
jgi:hypothetical protein